MAEGRRIGKYDLLDLLGRGGCGEVWRARDTELGRLLALKLLQHTSHDDLVRFRREAQAAGRVTHPHIAPVYEFSLAPPYLAMQFVDGVPLSEFVAEGAREARAILEGRVRALSQAARAVDHAHGAGIVHRDLKPGNILVNAAGEAYVLDFGLARETRGDVTAMTLTGEVLGTPSYMPPEQAKGRAQEVGPRSDVYGLGATLYHVLTGRPPHTGATAYEVVRKAIEEDPAAPEGDRELAAVCLKAIEKDADRRYASAADLADDLDRWLNREPVRAKPPSIAYRLRKQIQRRPAVWGLAATLTVALLGGSAVAVGLLARALGAERGAREQADRVASTDRAAREDAERRVQAEGVLETARRALHRLDIMQREEEADPEEPAVAQEALDRLDEVERVYPGLATTRLERGRVYVMMGREDDALAEFGAAIEANPQMVDPRLERTAILARRYEEMRHESTGTREETPAMAEVRRRVEEDVATVEAWSREERDVESARGIVAFARGEYDEAVVHLRAYLRANPVDAVGWWRLGHSLYHLGRHEEAVDALTRGIHHRPRYVNAYNNRGLALYGARDWVGAISDYDRALQLDPGASAAYGNRGLARQALGDLTGAIADYDRAIELNPGEPVTHLNRGTARQEEGDPSGAVADYERAMALSPCYAEAYTNRGNVRQAHGDLLGAIADYDHAIELDPGLANAYFKRADARGALGDAPRAMSDYDHAVRLNPELAEAFNNRGFLRQANGDLPGAIADYDRAIELSPGLSQAYNNRGMARYAQGNVPGSLADFERAIQIDPQFAEAISSRGVVRLESGDLPLAMADFERAIELNPALATAYNGRGNAREGQGDLAGAIADYGRAIELDPEFAGAYSNRGIVLYAQGDLASAITDLDRAIELDPRSAMAHYNRGNIRQAQRDPAGAISDYDRAIELNPGLPTAYNNRGNARRAQGDLAGAIADYDRAIELNPANASAHRNRATARERARDIGGAITDFERYLELTPAARDAGEVRARVEGLRQIAAAGMPPGLPEDATRIEGSLDVGDATLPSGAFADGLDFAGRSGQAVSVTLESVALDALLDITGPGGFRLRNDDALLMGTDSRLDFTLPADGTYTVTATSYGPRETGGYVLRVWLRDAERQLDERNPEH